MPNNVNPRLLECFAGGISKSHPKHRLKPTKPQKPAKEPPSGLKRQKKKLNKYTGKKISNGIERPEAPLSKKPKSPFTRLSESRPLEKKLKSKKEKPILEDNPTTQESLTRLMRNLEHHEINQTTKPEHKNLFSRMRRQIKSLIGVYPPEDNMKVINPKY